MSHTQGEWRTKQENWDYGSYKVIAIDGPDEDDYWEVAMMAGGVDSHDLGTREEEQANARLMAAAPKLLEACRWARYLYDQLALGPLEAAAKYGPDYTPPSDEDWLKMRGMLEAAIAEAEKK
jgi:hypothetical protein